MVDNNINNPAGINGENLKVNENNDHSTEVEKNLDRVLEDKVEDIKEDIDNISHSVFESSMPSVKAHIEGMTNSIKGNLSELQEKASAFSDTVKYLIDNLKDQIIYMLKEAGESGSKLLEVINENFPTVAGKVHSGYEKAKSIKNFIESKLSNIDQGVQYLLGIVNKKYDSKKIGVFDNEDISIIKNKIKSMEKDINELNKVY